MPNKHISALLTLALGLWFLTGFLLPMTPSFIQFLGLMDALWVPVVRGWGLLGAGLSSVSATDYLRMSIWALQVWDAALHLKVFHLGLIFLWLY